MAGLVPGAALPEAAKAVVWRADAGWLVAKPLVEGGWLGRSRAALSSRARRWGIGRWLGRGAAAVHRPGRRCPLQTAGRWRSSRACLCASTGRQGPACLPDMRPVPPQLSSCRFSRLPVSHEKAHHHPCRSLCHNRVLTQAPRRESGSRGCEGALESK